MKSCAGRHLLLVRGGLKREFAYKTFHLLGLRLTVVERPFSPGVRFADRALVADLGDQGAVLERVLACHRADPVEALLTFNDSALPLTAAIGERLGLPCLPAEVVSRSVNKDYMRDWLRPRGVAMPGYRVCREPSDARLAADELGFPVVVKPVNRAASVAVSLARDGDELASAFLAARRVSRDGVALVEEFVDGPEFSVEAITVAGRTTAVTVTDKVTTGGPSFVEMGHTVPSTLDRGQAAAVAGLALAAVDALQLDNCCSHTEVKLGRDGPRLIEVNPRLGGDCIPDLVYLACGLNLYRVALDLAFGAHPALDPPRPWTGAAIRFFGAGPGRLAAVSGLGAALGECPGVRELCVWTDIGKATGSLSSNLDRLGYLITEADTPWQAQEAADRAWHAVRFEVQDMTPAG